MKLKFPLSAAATLLLSSVLSPASTLWNESANGDLSSTQATPSAATLLQGTNSVIGSVGVGDNRDWLTLTVPSGFQLSSITLFSYNSTDAQGFTGMQSGSVFTGSFNSPASYLGYAHFGTGATNPSTPTNLVGQDILPIMKDPSAAQGAQGFTTLGSGSYAFLIQQTGNAVTSYQFDYNVTAVPEPSLTGLLGLGGLALLRGRRRALTLTPGRGL
ncbi:MAG: PEP-CTERM sorting domain-containing protein [Verrucomicrobiota bacterium]